MTDQTAMRRLCGAFDPGNFSGSWVQDFLGSNLLAVCEKVVPGEDVRCLWSNTLHVDETAMRDMFVDYVPVTAEGKALFGDNKGVVATHYFITRPKAVEADFRIQGRSLEEPSASAMFILWKFIACQVRNLVRLKFQNRVSDLMFGVLPAHGVNPSIVWGEQLSWMSVCEQRQITGPARIRYMDRCTVSTLSADKLMRAIQSEVTTGQIVNLVAEAVQVNLRE